MSHTDLPSVANTNIIGSPEIPDFRWAILRRILSLVLLAAAIFKAYELATLPLLGIGVLNNRWFLVFLVEIEIIASAWLLAGTARKLTWRSTLFMWIAFLGVIGYEIASGADSCGCFGRVQINPWYMASFDIATIIALLFCQPTARTTKQAWKIQILQWLGMGFVAVGGATFGIWNLIHYSSGRLSNEGIVFADGTVVLEPEKWMGKPFPLWRYIDLGSQLMHGDWIVVLYRYDCDHCQRAVPRYAALSDPHLREDNALSIALVEIPPYASAERSLVQKHLPALWGKLSNIHDWFAPTPVAIRIHDGIVLTVATSDTAEDPEAVIIYKPPIPVH